MRCTAPSRKARLEVLPGTRHELERVEVGRLAGALVGFFG